MAVVRITASPAWHRRMAELVKDDRRMTREFLRAVDRREATAELRADEIRMLVGRLPDDEHVQVALRQLEDLERREAARPRARDIALGFARRF